MFSSLVSEPLSRSKAPESTDRALVPAHFMQLPRKGVEGGVEAIGGYDELDAVDQKWIDDVIMGTKQSVPKKRPAEKEEKDADEEDTKPKKKKSKKGEPAEGNGSFRQRP